MICPHCSADLQRKQRSGRTCSRCRKRFALEPKENPLHLHDLRVRKLAKWLADPGRRGAPPLRYTADQLRFAASHKVLAAGPSQDGGWTNCGCMAGFFGAFLVFAAAVTGTPWMVVPVLVGTVALVVLCLIGWAVDQVRGRARRRPDSWRRRIPRQSMTAAEFARLLARWEEVYGAPPPGMIRPGPITDVWPSTRPVALLYCADAGTSAFLTASGIVERRGVALISSGQEGLRSAVAADPVLPVLVLHDADPAGCLEVPRLRADLSPSTRVIDAGLRPRVASRAGSPVRIGPDRSVLDELAQAGSLTHDERSWLAEGNTYPLAAVRPARLLTAVERALTRIDPDEERAAAMGFLAWPERVG